MSWRPLRFLTLASAVICSGSLLLVVRSVFRADVIEATTNGYPYASAGMATVNGQFWLLWSPVLPFDRPYTWRYDVERAATVRPRLNQHWSKVWGIRWVGIGCGMSPYRILILPLWILPVLTAIPPARWWHMRRRATRGFPINEVATVSP